MGNLLRKLPPPGYPCRIAEGNSAPLKLPHGNAGAYFGVAAAQWDCSGKPTGSASALPRNWSGKPGFWREAPKMRPSVILRLVYSA
jgi:hypothetical protein